MRILFVIAAVAIAQVFPSCGGDESTQIVGWIEAKHVDSAAHSFVITLNSSDYEVPGYFFAQVEVGDLVKWDGKTWTIVRKAGQPPP